MQPLFWDTWIILATVAAVGQTCSCVVSVRSQAAVYLSCQYVSTSTLEEAVKCCEGSLIRVVKLR